MRRRQFPSDFSVLGYFPVAFHSNDSDTIQVRSRLKAHQGVAAVGSLQECIEICLKPLSENACCGHTCWIKSDIRVLLHFALTSYVANTSETENGLEIRRRGQTNYPCRKCMVMKEKLYLSSQFSKRNARKTQQTMKSTFQKSSTAKEVEQYFAEESMLPLLPVLFSFLFAGIHFTLDIYGIFRYKPLHCLSLGIEGILKECIVYLLDDDQRPSPAMRR